MKKFKLNLQLFNEGFGDGAGAGGSDNGLANQNNEPEPKVLYGKQTGEPETGADDGTSVQGMAGARDEDTYEAFKAKYHDEIGKDIQDAIARRFKNSKTFEEDYNKLSDIMAPFYQKYGVNVGDLDSLANAINSDDTLFDDVAERNGMTPEAWQRFQRMEAENRRLAAQTQQAQVAEKARRDFDGWVAQAEELRQLYPGFDLAKECENSDFMADLKAGKSVRKAYEAAHLEEILAGAIQHTADSVKKTVTDGIRARGMRPAENGTSARSGVVVKDDVNSLTDEDIDRVLKLVKRGANISF